jgi:hypothetical protein
MIISNRGRLPERGIRGFFEYARVSPPPPDQTVLVSGFSLMAKEDRVPHCQTGGGGCQYLN